MSGPRLSALPWADLPGGERLFAALGAGNGDTRVVGGAVRDGWLGLPVSDVDLATRLLPDEVMRRLGAANIKAVPTGLKHGTVTAVTGGRPVEVTTLRRDVSTDGRHAEVAFSEDWREDAARRDFTINALFADPLSGEMFDFFGGLADLQAAQVRFIGDPLTRIAEDHLRILRFFRFHARFGRGAPDADGLQACGLRANDLMALSRERIADELTKLLALPDPGPTVAVMIERGVFAPVLPEIVDASPVARLIAREKACGIAPDCWRRLAALLPPEPALAERVAARLRLSKAATARLCCAAARDGSDTATPLPVLAYWHGAACARDRLLLGAGDLDPDTLGPLASWTRPRLPFGGGELIARGLAAGPVVARTLQAIERTWVDAGFPDGPALERIVDDQLGVALRSSQ